MENWGLEKSNSENWSSIEAISKTVEPEWDEFLRMNTDKTLHPITESDEDFKIEEEKSEDSDEILGPPQIGPKQNILWDLFSKLHLDNSILKGK